MVTRLAFGPGMAAGIILGFAAIRRGDIGRRQAWMTRAYGAGWGINLAVAEYVIHRHSSHRANRAIAKVAA